MPVSAKNACHPPMFYPHDLEEEWHPRARTRDFLNRKSNLDALQTYSSCSQEVLGVFQEKLSLEVGGLRGG